MLTPQDAVSYVAIGATGGGFSLDSLRRGLARGADFVGMDAGSSDMGAYALGGRGDSFPSAALSRDVAAVFVEAHRRSLPLIIGSCGLAGTNAGVNAYESLIRDAAESAGIRITMAKIYADVDRHWLKDKLRSGRVLPLEPEFDYSEEAIDRSANIVGVMGVEPIQAALDAGADVVLAGRSSDTAVFAAQPLRCGMGPAASWLAAKTAECGAAAATPPRTDCLFVTVGSDWYEVEPLADDLRCTPQSVAAHQFYESADPYLRTEPSGVIDATTARYEASSDRTVRVTGGRFIPASRYTVKLEGCESAGYARTVMVSIRDPAVVQHFDDWLGSAQPVIDRRIEGVLGSSPAAPYEVHTRVYGRDGTMGAWEPDPEIRTHELFLLVDVVSPDAAVAENVAAIIWYVYIHHAKYSRGYPTLAWPYNPHILDRGRVFRFNVNHVVEVGDPLEMFKIDMVTV